jgi:hypothetical protein
MRWYWQKPSASRPTAVAEKPGTSASVVVQQLFYALIYRSQRVAGGRTHSGYVPLLLFSAQPVGAGVSLPR